MKERNDDEDNVPINNSVSIPVQCPLRIEGESRQDMLNRVHGISETLPTGETTHENIKDILSQDSSAQRVVEERGEDNRGIASENPCFHSASVGESSVVIEDDDESDD